MRAMHCLRMVAMGVSSSRDSAWNFCQYAMRLATRVQKSGGRSGSDGHDGGNARIVGKVVGGRDCVKGCAAAAWYLVPHERSRQKWRVTGGGTYGIFRP